MHKKSVLLLILSVCILFMSSCTHASDNPFTAAGQKNDSLTILSDYKDDIRLCVSVASSLFKTEHEGVTISSYPGFTREELLDDRNFEIFLEKLAAEMMAGKGPDIFIFDFTDLFGSELYKKMDSGAFYDLNILIDYDKDFDMSLFEEKVLDAGLYRGKRYSMPISYNVPVFFTTQDKLDSYDISLEDLMTYEGLLGGIKDIQEKDGYCSDGLLSTYCYGWFNEYLDFDEGKASLSNPTFSLLMDVSRSDYMQNTNRSVYTISYHDDFMYTDNQVLYESLFPGMSALFLNASVKDETPPEILTVSNAYGNTTAYVYYYILVSSSTENLKNAWDYINIFLGEKIQGNVLKLMSSSAGVRTEFIDTTIDFISKECIR